MRELLVDEFKTLLELVYIGEWLANGPRLADERLMPYVRLEEQNGPAALEEMSRDERFTRLSALANRYEEELERFGVERLRIVESPEV